MDAYSRVMICCGADEATADECRARRRLFLRLGKVSRSLPHPRTDGNTMKKRTTEFGKGPWGRPALVVAHRGASGYLPEHTLEAYALAYDLGADMLEPDLVLTADDVVICMHDIHLERVTDVAQRFPGRAREDGRFYAADFTLDEIRRLSATGGDRHRLRGCGVPTFQEFLSLVAHLNESTGRDVGIVPELKAPGFHRTAKRPLEEVYVQALREAGYDAVGSRCITQSFEPDALVRLRSAGIQSTLLELLSGEAPDRSQLAEIAKRAEAIGPPKSMIESTEGQLVRDAHDLRLAVVPYTFKDDEADARRFFRDYDVDALFSDFPDVALRARR